MYLSQSRGRSSRPAGTSSMRRITPAGPVHHPAGVQVIWQRMGRPAAVDPVERQLGAAGTAVQAVADRLLATARRAGRCPATGTAAPRTSSPRSPHSSWAFGLQTSTCRSRVEHHHGRPQAAEDRVQVEVDVSQLLGPLLELVVHRRAAPRWWTELLVHGLQLFVGRLQLLVGGLQLLDGGLQLLVGGLQLLVGRLQLLVGGLQLLVGPLQLGAELVLQRVIEEGDADAEQRRRRSSVSGRTWTSSVRGSPPCRLPLDIRQRHAQPRDAGRFDVRAQLDGPVGDLEVLEQPAEVRRDRG